MKFHNTPPFEKDFHPIVSSPSYLFNLLTLSIIGNVLSFFLILSMFLYIKEVSIISELMSSTVNSTPLSLTDINSDLNNQLNFDHLNNDTDKPKPLTNPDKLKIVLGTFGFFCTLSLIGSLLKYLFQ